MMEKFFSKKDGHIYSSETLLQDIAPSYQKYYDSKIVGAVVNNKLCDLKDKIGEYENFFFIELSSELGNRIFKRSVRFLLVTAAAELYPQLEVIVKFTVNSGLYCVFEPAEMATPEVVNNIERRMREIVKEGRPFIKRYLHREDAIRLFKDKRYIAKANLLSGLKREYVSVYYCGDTYDYMFGAMMSNTSELDKFEIDSFRDGVLLRSLIIGTEDKVATMTDQSKFCSILDETEKLAGILECSYVPDLNRYIRTGKIGELIHLSELLHETRLSEIAWEIKQNIAKKRLILIAGPSSSGKTSFAQRLKMHLRLHNIKAVSVSMDDYYCNRVDTPRLPDGNYDFECLEALDVKLFNDHLKRLLDGEAVSLPRYNFQTGEREKEGSLPMCLSPDQPIIVEGIHGLNEALTPIIPREMKYKIYVSALTPLNLDMHNRLHTTDTRLVRRIVRDYKYRSSPATKNLRQWESVRAGEEKYIFPFQEEADAIFNTTLFYELAVLKKYLVPIIDEVPKSDPFYTFARSIRDYCDYFESIDDESDIPNCSILREFIGGSWFFDKDGKLKE